MKISLILLAAFLLLASTASRAQDPTDNPFANFGGTDYFPASSGTVSVTNSALAAVGNNISGVTELSTGSSSLSGGSASSVPEAGYTSGPSLNAGSAPSSVPSDF